MPILETITAITAALVIAREILTKKKKGKKEGKKK
jgi:hypothetical protein